MSLPKYFIGVGDIYATLLDANGLPLAFHNMGEAPTVEWDQTIEYADNFKTNRAAPNTQDLHYPIKGQGLLTLKLIEKTIKNLEIWLGSASTPVTAASYTGNDAFPTGIVAGDVYLVPKRHVGLTAVVLKDTAGSPITLVNGGADPDYTVDANTGLITFVKVPGVQPYKAFSYGFAAGTKFSLLSQAPPLMAVMFDGQNLLPSAERIRIIWDTIAFEAAAKIALKAGSATGVPNTREEFEMKGPAFVGQGKVLATDGFGEYREY